VPDKLQRESSEYQFFLEFNIPIQFDDPVEKNLFVRHFLLAIAIKTSDFC